MGLAQDLIAGWSCSSIQSDDRRGCNISHSKKILSSTSWRVLSAPSRVWVRSRMMHGASSSRHAPNLSGKSSFRRVSFAEVLPIFR